MKNIAIRILYKLIIKTALNTRAEILKSIYKVWPWNKLKEPVFSIIRLEGYVNFFIGKVSQVLCFPGNSVAKIENLVEGFLRSFFPNFAHSVIGTVTQCLFKCRVGNKTRLKKLTEVSNYGKFIWNIFGWDTVKRGVIIRAKVQFSVWI